MTNSDFLEVIKESFKKYLEVGSSRSTAKLKNLHGSIASDLLYRLNNSSALNSRYEIKSQGIADNKEGKITGRYYDKNVDILVSKNGRPVAGYAVKFVMQNYSRNSNNYFENMLGETANIRSNCIPYFQIFIVFSKMPYFNKDKEITGYDTISEHNIQKYVKLSKDNVDIFFHTPNKTLFIVIKLKNDGRKFANLQEYSSYYNSVINDDDLMQYDSDVIQDSDFADCVMINNYDEFMDKTHHLILLISNALLKFYSL